MGVKGFYLPLPASFPEGEEENKEIPAMTMAATTAVMIV